MKDNFIRILLGYSTIGIQLALTILLFLYAGHIVDKRYDSSPAFLIGFTVVGMIMGFYNLIKSLQDFEKNLKKKHDESKDAKKRVKWL